jgi:hypothetical protein
MELAWQANAEFIHQLALAGHGVIRAKLHCRDGHRRPARGTIDRLVLALLPIHVVYPHRPLLSAKVRSFDR